MRKVINLRLFSRAGLGLLLALSLAACAQTVIYEKASSYNNIIVTEDSNGLRTLLFERYGGRQSVVKPGDPDHLELAYSRVALVGLALCEAQRRFLVVGLGGGSLPMFLRKHYPDAEIDAVEIDPGVVDVAKQYFGFREDERMHAHVGDGRRFIENVRQPYDMIILDAFGARSVPAHLATLEFLQAVRRAVAPSGVVVSNIWRPSHNDLYNEMIRTHQAAFDELFLLEVPGDVNNILLALPRKQAVNRSELIRNARNISAEKKFRFDLGDFIVYGFAAVTDRTYPGRVLRDADLKQSR
jgi:spermidine synthase